MKNAAVRIAAIVVVMLLAPAARGVEVCTYRVTRSSGLLCPYRPSSTACVPVTTAIGNCNRELRCLGNGLQFSCDLTASPVGGPDRVCAFGSRLLTGLRCVPVQPRLVLPTATPTEIEPTASPTATEEEVADTPTATPIQTAVASATATEEEDTPTATPIFTAVPTGTATATVTGTSTAPTGTPTTAVPTSTSTPPPAATETMTEMPTAAATNTPTNTMTPPPAATNTATPAATNTATPAATNTATSTATLTVPPAATNTATPAATNTATPPATNTATPAATDTATPPPTLSQHTCNISTATGASVLTLNANILGGAVTIPIPITGSLSLGLNGGTPDGTGKLGADCNIINIGDINAGSIGWVCVSPNAGCPAGEADCDGGNVLGISAQGDGNTGACASEAACDTSCVAFCSPAAVLSSGCTGFCTEGAMMACTSDAQCLAASQGSCNGPDAGNMPGICQCSCINAAAGGASAAGDLQCNLGANIQVRGMGATSCTTGSVTINVGATCIPLSTQVAQGQITDANFTPNLKIPPDPGINLTGARVACTTLQASTTTGIKVVGAVNFFGSTLGDLAVSLQTTCQ